MQQQGVLNARQQRIAAWASRFVQQPNIVLLDSETTGLGPEAQLVELAVITLDGSILLNSLIKPSCPISKDAQKVHGITEAMIADAPTFVELHPQLRTMLKDKTVLVYNADFDRGRIRHMERLHQLSQQAGLHWSCLMMQYAEFYGQRGYYGDYRWQSLEAACGQQGVEMAQAHRALGDTLSSLALLRRLAEYGSALTPVNTIAEGGRQ